MSTNPATSISDDALDLISLLAGVVAHALAGEYMPSRLHEPDPRYEMIDKARTVLMQNARHVPVAVDKILELALSQGGYAPASRRSAR